MPIDNRQISGGSNYMQKNNSIETPDNTDSLGDDSN